MRPLYVVLFLVFQFSAAKAIQPQFRSPSPTFTQNRGQVISTDSKAVPEIKFYSGSPGGVQTYFTPTRVSYVFPKIEVRRKQYLGDLPKEIPKPDSMEAMVTELYRMDVEFVGANPNAQIIGSDESSEYTNYYLGHCPDGITHVPSYGKLIVKDLYPNIDAVWKTTENGLKSEFIVHPGGDYRRISIHYTGANVEHTPGIVTASTPLGTVRDESPVSFQNGNTIQTEFHQTGTNYGFLVGKYDKTQPLVIDPMIVWGQYQIGTTVDFGLMGMRVDQNGNVIIAGGVVHPSTTTFPASAGAFQTQITTFTDPESGEVIGRDFYIAKFDNSGTRSWGTYYGGTGLEPMKGAFSANCLALDANNSIIVVGSCFNDSFPLANAAQATFGGQQDMVVVKLTSGGTREWATYYGGSAVDGAASATVDGSGNVIVVGWTKSTNFPTTASVFQQASANSNETGAVVKFNSSGALQWATYFGNNTNSGINYNFINAVASDGSGNIYITGAAWGQGYPTTAGTHQPTNDTAFFKITVASLTPNGQRRWATFHSCGSGNDIICDNTNLYVVGSTIGATIYDVTLGTYIIKGMSDICIFSLENSSGHRNGSSWSRLFGGTDVGSNYGTLDYGQSIAFGADNDIWVGGLAANSSDFPMVNTGTYPAWTYDIQQTYKGGNADGFFAHFNKANGAAKYSSFFGSTGNDLGGYAIPYGSSALFFGINTASDAIAGSLPVPAPKRLSTPYSISLTKICTSYGLNVDAGTTPITLCSGDTIQIGAAPTSGHTYTWSSRTYLSDSTIANPKAFPTNTGTGLVTVKYELLETDAGSGCYGRDTIVINVKQSPALGAAAAQPPQCFGNTSTYSLMGMYTPVATDILKWEAAGGVIVGDDNKQAVQVNWTTVGIDTVYLRVTNSIGCSAYARLPVEVTALPEVNAGIDPPPVCEGTNVQLSGSATGGTGTLSYSWTPLIGISSPTIPNPVVVPTEPLTDYILSVTDSRGCIGHDTVRIVMNPKPIAFAGEDREICQGESTQLSASSSGGLPPYIISWTPATGLNAANVSDPVAKPTITTNYVYTVTDSKGCKNFDTIKVTVLQKPTVTAAQNALDFGKLDGCTSSLEKIDSIENKGTVPVQLTDYKSDDSSFSVSTGLPVTIAPGQKVGLKLKYSPAAAKSSSGKITLNGAPCGVALAITVSGEKLSLAVKSSPSGVNFGQSISCMGRTADTMISITNTGTDVLTLTQPVIQLPYSIVNQSFPHSVKVGESIKIQVHYAPTADGNYAQTIGFPFSAGVCRDTIKISMNGVSISPTATISPTDVQFPSLSGCETSRDSIVVLENTSAADIRVDSSVGGTVFKVTFPPVPFTVKAGAKQNITITFQPTTAGASDDSVRLALSPCSRRIALHVSGNKQGASFAFADTLDAGEIISCVKNSSTIKLKIENTSSGGASGGVTTVNAGKTITTTLINGTSLPNGSPLEFDVTITPTVNGSFVDSLVLVFNPCGITRTVYVKGRMTSVGFKADITNVDFGKIQTTTNRSIPVLFTNTGSTALTIANVPNLAAPFTVESIVPPLPAILQPGEKLTITVKYTAESGVQTSKIFAFGAVPCPTSDSVQLQGEGTVNPQPSFSTTSVLNFDSVCIGKEKLLALQLFNNGGVTLQLQRADVTGSDFTVKNFVPQALPSGGKIDVTVGFIPQAIGSSSGRIVWVTDLLSDTTELSGIGKDCGSTPPDSSSTTVKMADVQADVGKKVNLALVLTKSQGLEESGASKFSAKVRINQRILHITDPSIVCTNSANPSLCEVDITGEYKKGNDTLGIIPAEATLGDVESASIDLLDFRWLNGKGVVNVERESGEFRLTNLCMEGGIRLYQSDGIVSINVMPNPASGTAEIEYSLREETHIKVTLMNILGREVMVLDDAVRKAGLYRQTVGLSDIGDGVYFLMLQCPNTVETIRMSVVK